MMSNGRVAPAIVPAPTSRPVHRARPPQEGLLPALWKFWKAYAHRASSYQSVVLLTLVYYAVLGPSALVARLTGKQLLRTSTGQARSYWLERPKADHSLAALERQF